MKDKLIVYLDMDGVLVDWLEGVREFAGKPVEFHKQFADAPETLSESTVDYIYGKEFVRKLNNERPPEFWLNLKRFKWADALISALLAKGYEVAFFTSPGDNPNAASGKIMWQQKYYPNIPLIMGKHKHLAAAENKVLIDDNPMKVDNFRKFGGLAIQWHNQFAMARKTEEQIQAYINEVVGQIENYRLVNEFTL